MNLSKLPFLVCPARVKDTPCGGPLTVGEGPLATLYAPGTEDELWEGGLTCSRCTGWYPVVAGVAVVLPDVQGYLGANGTRMATDAEQYAGLSAGAATWLRAQAAADTGAKPYGADFRLSQHYDTLADAVDALTPDGTLYDSFRANVREWSVCQPFDVLAEMGERHGRHGGLLLDAGCGPGGLTYRMAANAMLAFGIDVSFLAILLARRVVLRLPNPLHAYELRQTTSTTVERPLPAETRPQTEFLVADCRALPFAAGLFDTVCSANVIDMAGGEPVVQESARVLRREGLFLLTDPFKFESPDDLGGEVDPLHATRLWMERARLHVLEERDGVPWAWPVYDRHFRLYFNYCAAARKAD